VVTVIITYELAEGTQLLNEQKPNRQWHQLCFLCWRLII